MNIYPKCPKCSCNYVYDDSNFYICPECNYEWSMNEKDNLNIKVDVNGNELNNGDSVVTIKDLPIKGTSTTIKRGTKVKIKLTQDDGVGHDIECKFDGVGTIKLKTSLVKKV